MESATPATLSIEDIWQVYLPYNVKGLFIAFEELIFVDKAGEMSLMLCKVLLTRRGRIKVLLWLGVLVHHGLNFRGLLLWQLQVKLILRNKCFGRAVIIIQEVLIYLDPVLEALYFTRCSLEATISFWRSCNHKVEVVLLSDNYNWLL